MGNDGGTVEAGGDAERRLNPSAFPAETRARFTLMVVAAVMLVFWLGLSLPAFFGLGSLTVPTETASLDDLPGMADWEGTLVEYRARLLAGVGVQLTWLAVPVGIVLLLFVVAALLYRTHPRWIRRRFPVTPLVPEADPKLHGLVRTLVDRAAPKREPQIELGTSLRMAEGQAYGLEEAYALRVDGGLRRALVRQPYRVEAVVLHELGHMANRDVGPYQFSLALWTALVVLVFVPAVAGYGYRVVLTLIEGGKTWLALLLMAQLPLVFALVRAIQAGLARVREYFADWQAALWGGRAALTRVFEATASEEHTTLWKRPWRLHPPVGERLAALHCPERLFRLSWDMPLVVGTVLAFVTAGLYVASLVFARLLHAATTAGSVTLMLAEPSGRAAYTGVLRFGWIAVSALLLLPFAAIGYWLAGTLALQVQRAAVVDLWGGASKRARYLSLWRPAALLTLGLEIGFALTPNLPFSPLLGLLGIYRFDPLWLVAVWAATTALNWLSLCYARFAAQRVLGTHFGRSQPTRKWRLLTLAFAVLLAAWYVPLLLWRQELLTGIPQVPPGLTLAGLSAVALGLGLVLFGGTWLLTGGWRGRLLPCPECGRRPDRPQAIGQFCTHCGQELAPWLLAPGT